VLNAIVFDLDGTLVNTHHHIHHCFTHALEPFNLQATKELFEQIRHQSTHELFCGFLEDHHAEEARNRLKEITLTSLHHVKLYPGILELVEILSEKNIPMAVWTGRDGNSAEQILKDNCIYHYFKKLMASCHVKNNKPSPDGLNSIIQDLKLDPKKTLMVGDHMHDLQGAKGAGCLAGLAKWGLDTDLMPQGFDYNLEHPLEILKAFALR
jgi:HAD superfamily hydrolase (TIGR01509 family)